jgi:hypothetical protein
LVDPPQISKEEHSLKHYGGINVALTKTSIRIVDETSAMWREMKASGHPKDPVRAFHDPASQLVRIELEVGPFSQWLFRGLAHAGLPVN